ncbi:MAG TPA: hypothetical protein VF187_03175 [Gemmatimonadales bacterium]
MTALLFLATAADAAAQGALPLAVSRSTEAFKDRRISESSGVVASRAFPGRLWTMNDSGNEAMLFLTDSSGAALGAFTVPGARNRDWESLGRGPCGTRECLYIGDTGDNAEKRRSVTLYRVPEPAPPASRGDGETARPEMLQVQYHDGPHDTEAMYIEPDGAVMLMTKGRSGGILTFRVASGAWRSSGVASADRVDSLPIPASLFAGRVVTDAALSPDGRRVVARTYRELWFFDRDAAGRLHLDAARPVCEIPPGIERQGEGVDWWNGETLVLTSERGLKQGGAINLVVCPAR